MAVYGRRWRSPASCAGEQGLGELTYQNVVGQVERRHRISTSPTDNGNVSRASGRPCSDEDSIRLESHLVFRCHSKVPKGLALSTSFRPLMIRCIEDVLESRQDVRVRQTIRTLRQVTRLWAGLGH